MVAASLTDFLSTDFTCPSISRPGREAEARGRRPWCPAASASTVSGAVAPPCRHLQDAHLRCPVDQKQTSKAGAQARRTLASCVGVGRPCPASPGAPGSTESCRAASGGCAHSARPALGVPASRAVSASVCSCYKRRCSFSYVCFYGRNDFVLRTYAWVTNLPRFDGAYLRFVLFVCLFVS